MPFALARHLHRPRSRPADHRRPGGGLQPALRLAPLHLAKTKGPPGAGPSALEVKGEPTPRTSCSSRRWRRCPWPRPPSRESVPGPPSRRSFPFRAAQRVVAGERLEHVTAVAAVEHVIALPAVQLVCALPAVERVVAEVARVQDVLAHAAPEHVVAGVPGAAAAEHSAVDQVVALLARELIGPVAALQRVSSHAAADEVVAAVARDLIRAAARSDHVVARRTVDHIGVLRADDGRGLPEAGRVLLRLRPLAVRAGRERHQPDQERWQCQHREFAHVVLPPCGSVDAMYGEDDVRGAILWCA